VIIYFAPALRNASTFQRLSLLGYDLQETNKTTMIDSDAQNLILNV